MLEVSLSREAESLTSTSLTGRTSWVLEVETVSRSLRLKGLLPPSFFSEELKEKEREPHSLSLYLFALALWVTLGPFVCAKQSPHYWQLLSRPCPWAECDFEPCKQERREVFFLHQDRVPAGSADVGRLTQSPQPSSKWPCGAGCRLPVPPGQLRL